VGTTLCVLTAFVNTLDALMFLYTVTCGELLYVALIENIKCFVLTFSLVLSQIGIRLTLYRPRPSYSLFTFNPGYYYFNFLWFS